MKPFYKLFLFHALLVFAFSESVAQVTLPRTPSPAAVASQTIGISTVTVNYSRPSVKGRKVWGELVPFGWNVQAFGAGNSAPWRAGANENTVITFSHDAKVEGQNVPAGSYGFFLVINSDNSGEVILSKSFKSWGSFFYDQAQDQLRAKIQLRDLPYSVESLTYDFMNATKYSAELVLNWEKKQFPVKIEFDVDKIVMANAKEVLKGQTGFNPQSFVTAAGYAMNNNIELEQGVKWIDQAITNGAPNPGNAQGIKYNLLTKLGKTSDAEKLFQNVITNSNENDVNLFAYQLSGQGLHDKAIEAFVSNTKRFPNSPNTWDSLGEGYANKGDKENAIKSFKKSLSMNPPSGVKANSEKFLKQFGAM